MLQDVLDDVDREMLRSYADDINEFADIVVSFVSMLANDIIPMETIKICESETVGSRGCERLYYCV